MKEITRDIAKGTQVVIKGDEHWQVAQAIGCQIIIHPGGKFSTGKAKGCQIIYIAADGESEGVFEANEEKGCQHVR